MMTDSLAEELGSEEVVDEVEETEETTLAEPEAEDNEAEGEEELTEEEPEEWEFKFGSDRLTAPKASVPEELAAKLNEFAAGVEQSSTKKFQEVAEARKNLEAQQKAYEKLSNLQGEALQVFGRGQALRQELDALGQVDLQSLWQSDPDKARQLSDDLNRKQAEFQNVVAQVGQYEQAIEQEQSQNMARLYDEGKVAVDKAIPGFSTTHANEVIEYAVSKGIPKEQAETWPLNPFAAMTTYKAMLYDRMQAKAKATPKTKQPVTPVKPAKAKGGGRSSNKPPTDSEQYAKWWAKRQKTG